MHTFTVTKLIRMVLVAAVAAFAAQAENFDLIQAPVTAADWTNSVFYSGGRAPTGISSDIVRTTISKKLAISIDGNADDFPAITNFLNSIYAFSFSGATITFIVPDGRKVSLTRPFYSSNSSAELGTVYKYGAGDLSLEAVRILSPSSTSSTDYQGEWKVMEGTLHILPNAPEGGYWWVMDYNYVAEGAKIVIPATGGSGAWQILELEGAGLVTNESTTTTRIYKNASPRKDLVSFAGVLGPNISMYVRSSLMDFQGTANRASISTGTTNGKNYTGTLYLRKLGNVNDAESSMGPGSVTTPNRFVYTGLGETSDRRPYVHGIDTLISGGTNGNLRLTGVIGGHWGSERNHAAITFDGDNLYPCWFESAINDWTTDSNANRWDVYIKKTGCGQWNLVNPYSTTAGTVEIADGVLGCELLGRRGEASSLGCSTNCHELAQQYDDSNKVDYAIRLGDAENDAAVGLLENTSADAMMVVDRPFVLAGRGGFRQNVGEGVVKYANVKGIGTGAKTLVLDGTSLATNAVYDVSNGEGATVSVLKRGAGTWLLGGDLTFSGDLTVAGGTLIVKRAPMDKYGFYRISVCEVANNNTDYYSAEERWPGCNVEMVQVGLWAADTTRQNMNLNFVRQGELRPGTVAQGWNRTISGNLMTHGFNLFELLFTGSRAPKLKGIGEDGYTQIWNLFSRSFIEPGKTQAVDGGPNRDKPFSWLHIDMCLAEGAKPVTLFDVACGGDNAEPHYSRCWVTAIQLWGSVDGIHWEDLSGIRDGVKPTSTYRWISGYRTYDSGGGCTASSEFDIATDWRPNPADATYNRTSGGFAATNTVPMKSFSVLENVGSVKVTGGATLKFVGEDAPAISHFEVDPASGGTLDGFALAATGTLNLPLDNFDGQSLTLPLSFANMDVSALANWHLSMNGVTKLRSPRMAYRNGTLVVFKSGISISFR